MSEQTIIQWLGSVLRKVLAGALVTVGTFLVQQGALTQGQWDQWLELTAVALAFVANMAWSKWVLPWLKRAFRN